MRSSQILRVLPFCCCCAYEQLFSLTLKTNPRELWSEQYITSGLQLNQQQSQLKPVNNEQLDILTDAYNEKHTVVNEMALC